MNYRLANGLLADANRSPAENVRRRYDLKRLTAEEQLRREEELAAESLSGDMGNKMKQLEKMDFQDANTFEPPLYQDGWKQALIEKVVRENPPTHLGTLENKMPQTPTQEKFVDPVKAQQMETDRLSRMKAEQKNLDLQNEGDMQRDKLLGLLAGAEKSPAEKDAMMSQYHAMDRIQAQDRQDAIDLENFRLNQGNQTPQTPQSNKGNSDWGNFDPSWQGIKNFGSNVATVGGGMLSDLRKGAHNLFNDPTRMAMIQGGLTALDPNSYYDKDGFYSTAGGINRALSSARNAYQNVGYRGKEAIKQKNALELANAKLTPYTMNSRGQVIDKRTGTMKSPSSGQAGMFLDANQIMNQEMKLGKDFATESSVERDQVDAYRRIEAIYADPMAELPNIDSPTVEGGIQLTKVLNPKTGDIFDLTAGGAADLALIFNFMKMLDPASVVREGEFALAEATGGFSETLKKEYAKVTSGQRLTPTMRRNIMRQARTQYNSAEKNLRQKHKDYVKRAELYRKWGIDADRALAYSPYQPTIPREAFRQPVVSVNGKPVVSVNGKKVVDPNNSLGLDPRFNRKGR